MDVTSEFKRMPVSPAVPRVYGAFKCTTSHSPVVRLLPLVCTDEPESNTLSLSRALDSASAISGVGYKQEYRVTKVANWVGLIPTGFDSTLELRSLIRSLARCNREVEGIKDKGRMRVLHVTLILSPNPLTQISILAHR